MPSTQRIFATSNGSAYGLRAHQGIDRRLCWGHGSHQGISRWLVRSEGPQQGIDWLLLCRRCWLGNLDYRATLGAGFLVRQFITQIKGLGTLGTLKGDRRLFHLRK